MLNSSDYAKNYASTIGKSLIPIHPADWHLLGIYWQSQYYVDLYLPFGLRSAPFLFNLLSEALEWILKNNYGLKHVLHILDDFFIAEPSRLQCVVPENIHTPPPPPTEGHWKF